MKKKPKNKRRALANKPNDNTPKPRAFNPDAALDLHLEAMGIAKALYGQAAGHVIAGWLAFFYSSASGIEVAA
jgi:hypothetical protein